MTYSSDETGAATFSLSPAEHAAFKNGQPIVKVTGDMNGMVTITLKKTKPRSKKDRFPADVYGEGYVPPEHPVSATVEGTLALQHADVWMPSSMVMKTMSWARY